MDVWIFTKVYLQNCNHSTHQQLMWKFNKCSLDISGWFTKCTNSCVLIKASHDILDFLQNVHNGLRRTFIINNLTVNLRVSKMSLIPGKPMRGCSLDQWVASRSVVTLLSRASLLASENSSSTARRSSGRLIISAVWIQILINRRILRLSEQSAFSHLEEEVKFINVFEVILGPEMIWQIKIY